MENYFQFGRNEYAHKITDTPKLNERSNFYKHTHLNNELFYFLSGDAKLITERGTYLLHPGDVFYIPSKQYHFVVINADTPYERIVINFFSDEQIAKLPEQPNVLSANFSKSSDIHYLFLRFETYEENFKGWQFERLANNCLFELLSFYMEKVHPHESSENSSAEKVLIAAIEYINAHLASVKDIQEVASAVFVSCPYLYQLFQKHLHISPKKFITAKRLALAHEMILSGKSPLVSCNQCGYKDYSTFYRAYYTMFGHAPSASRQS